MKWYYARLKWAVMEQSCGLRRWEESMLLYRAGDREAAFQTALRLGRQRQQTRETRRGWVDRRLAEVIELDELWDGQQIPLGSKPADQAIDFAHRFEPERSTPQPAF